MFGERRQFGLRRESEQLLEHRHGVGRWCRERVGTGAVDAQRAVVSHIAVVVVADSTGVVRNVVLGIAGVVVVVEDQQRPGVSALA